MSTNGQGKLVASHPGNANAFKHGAYALGVDASRRSPAIEILVAGVGVGLGE